MSLMPSPSIWNSATPTGGGGGSVTAVFGRTGNVNATAGDYTAAQVTGALDAANNLSDVANKATSRANLNLDKYTTFSDANYTVLTTDKYVAQIGTLTAARTVTLPAANTVNAGFELIIGDDSGTVTPTNTIIVARASTDTIDGATSITMAAPYGARRFTSNGSNKWTYDAGVARVSNNLSDLTSASTARTNLGLGTAAVLNTSGVLQPSNNLSDVSSAATSRTNLGLGTAAVLNTSGVLQPSNNLSDVSSASTSRTNLGLGTAATFAYSNTAEATYAGTITWTGTTAPSGATTHTFKWSQFDKIVFLRINLIYAVAGTALTIVQMALPSGVPAPIAPTGLTAASTIQYYGNGGCAVALTSPAANNCKVLANLDAGSAAVFTISTPSTNSLAAWVDIIYWTT